VKVTSIKRRNGKKTEQKQEVANMRKSVNPTQQGTTRQKYLTKLRGTNQIRNKKGEKICVF